MNLVVRNVFYICKLMMIHVINHEMENFLYKAFIL